MTGAIRMSLVAMIAVITACGGTRHNGTPEEVVDDYLAEGDTVAAIRHLDRSNLDDHPTAELYIQLGTLRREQDTIRDRLISQRVLEEAYQKYPDDPNVMMALASTYMAQTFYPDARRLLIKVLAADPANSEATEMIGTIHYDRWRRSNNYRDELLRARRYYTSTLLYDSTNTHVAARMVYVYYALGHMEDCQTAAETGMDRFPDVAEFHLMAGALAYDRGELDQAEHHFVTGANLLPPSAREQFFDIGNMLSYEGLDAFADAAADGERDTLERYWWLNRDIDPTTESNERRAEHMYRMFLSDVLFSVPFPPKRGWDTERGWVYVKYGTPDHVEHTLGGGNKVGRSENWFYTYGGYMQQYVFTDRLLNGDLKLPMSDESASFLGHTTALTRLRPAWQQIPATLDASVFRDNNLGASALIVMTVNADSLLDVQGAMPAHLSYRVSLFDEEWNAAGRSEDRLDIASVPKAIRYDEHSLLFQAIRPLPFAEVHVATAVNDSAKAAFALERRSLSASRFIRSTITSSDVMCLTGDDSGPLFVRRGQPLHLNPWRTYADGERAAFYFEVYNIPRREGQFRYNVSYEIRQAPDEAPTWKRWMRGAARAARILAEAPVLQQSFEREAETHETHDLIRIDIDALKPGPWDLRVTVTDPLNDEVADIVTVRFTKLKPGTDTAAAD